MTAATETYTCEITLVTPGHSDRVIKVHPAEHASEKIWLDNTPGIERWETIKRLMQTHASRFAPVYEPVPYCNDPKDLKTITLKPSDIPTVNLENFVLPAPAVIETKTSTTPESAPVLEERIARMEETVNKLAELMAKNTEKRGPGRPPKEDKND